MTTASAISAVMPPTLNPTYQQRVIHLLYPRMNPVFSLIEILYVKLQQVAHHIIKHEEASSLLYLLLPIVQQKEYGCEYLIHALHILRPGVDFGKNEKNSREIVILICFSLLFLIMLPNMTAILILPVD